MKNEETKIVLLYRLKGTEIKKNDCLRISMLVTGVEDDTYW